MSEPFIAEVRIVGFTFAPRGWAFCDGQLLPINQNQSLYSLLGTVYGGDGRITFALPDLRSRTPIHVGRADGGSNHPLGQKSGAETVTLSVTEIPQHDHELMASANAADQRDPTGRVFANADVSAYRDPTSAVQSMSPISLGSTGGGQAHQNMQPYLALNYCIALSGLFPSRN